ncbi:agmatine deiminase family protein [Streptomyces gamaensis]|uniref:Agmatine deiminase family protein n=1 Tax=Streptomyces gamaensis TaxID=1763542 RepID=A0ABW0Z9B1_9ACTN
MNTSRRRRMVRLGAVTAAVVAGMLLQVACGSGNQKGKAVDEFPKGGVMPAETGRHDGVYMAWPTAEVWEDMADGVQNDIAKIARTIAEYEPVYLFAGAAQVEKARKQVGPDVTVIEQPVDDLWMRDTAPTFVRAGEGLAAVDFGFNGWGGKQEHQRDADVARRVAEVAGVPRVKASLVAEGGSLETDGDGTLMATESSLVNDNRNPGKSRDDIERELKRLLGVQKVIWFKGVKDKEITDYHIDGIARFTSPGTVLLSAPAPGTEPNDFTRAYEQAKEVLANSTDAKGRKLRVVEVPEVDPAKVGQEDIDDFSGTYVNYYVANGAVIMPKFGDEEADRKAADIVAELYPGREVRQLSISTLVQGGGAIHCSTQQLPLRTP